MAFDKVISSAKNLTVSGALSGLIVYNLFSKFSFYNQVFFFALFSGVFDFIMETFLIPFIHEQQVKRRIKFLFTNFDNLSSKIDSTNLKKADKNTKKGNAVDKLIDNVSAASNEKPPTKKDDKESKGEKKDDKKASE